MIMCFFFPSSFFNSRSHWLISIYWEIWEMTPFTIVTNYIKCLGVTLTKQVKYLNVKNFKPPKKRNWRSPQKISRSPMLMGQLKYHIKWSYYQKQSTGSEESPSKFQLRKNNSQIYLEKQKFHDSENFLNNKRTSGESTSLNPRSATEQ